MQTMYSSTEKWLYLFDTLGELSESEVQSAIRLCPELARTSVRRALVKRQQLLKRRRQRGIKNTFGIRSSAGYLQLRSLSSISLLDRITSTLPSTDGIGCVVDSYRNTHELSPSPWMVDYIISLIPSLEKQALDLREQEAKEKPQEAKPKPQSNPSQHKLHGHTDNKPIPVALYGDDPEGPLGQLVNCIISHENRWCPKLGYDKVKRHLRDKLGNLNTASYPNDLSFEEVKTVLFWYARNTVRYCANEPFLTSGRLLRLLYRLRELREAEECPLIKPRKG